MNKRYLIIPVNDALSKKHYRLLRKDDGSLVYDFDAAIDPVHGVFDSYADITRFGDAALTLTDDDGTVVPHRESDHFPTLAEIPNGTYLRPAAHFTTRLGWTNDPNGLILHNGTYHMFYQHNPHSVNWGNMTWGHAVSDDLVHWEELGDTLFPDETGTMYSGSAYCDHENAAGFGKDAVLLFYTAAGKNNELSKDAPFTQCLAYSNDGGFTFRKYEKNPILPHIIGANRDPKIEWCPEIGRYTMSLYLDGNDYAIFASNNLLDWEKISDVRMPNDNECPDFYPLTVRGEDTVKWVFSGAHDTYLVGNMDSGTFTAEQADEPYHRGPGFSYAAQTFSGCGNRRIKIAWGQNTAPGAVFNCQMGLPCEMYLQRIGDKIRLGSYPVRETERLIRQTTEKTVQNNAGEVVLADAAFFGDCAADVLLEIGEDSAPFVLSGFGMTIAVDPSNGGGIYTHGDCTAPLTYTGEKKLRVIFDTLGAEIFADGGLIYSTIRQVADRTCGVKLTSEGEGTIKATVSALSM
ncbi:MAG: glycoside hydrolase family 32 protein [Eubacteriales bacterium]